MVILLIIDLVVGLGDSSYFTRWAGGKVVVWGAMKMELQNRYTILYMHCYFMYRCYCKLEYVSHYCVCSLVLKVRLDNSYGLLGIGKATEYDKQSAEATKQRKRLEVEVQLAETDHERKTRKDKVAREEQTRAQVSEI